MNERRAVLFKVANVLSELGVAIRELLRDEDAAAQAGERLMSYATAAERLEVSTATVRRLAKAGKLTNVMVGRQPRIPESSLTQYQTRRRSA